MSGSEQEVIRSREHTMARIFTIHHSRISERTDGFIFAPHQEHYA
jgi:hypothetical protein